jgi:hypothetical protein
MPPIAKRAVNPLLTRYERNPVCRVGVGQAEDDQKHDNAQLDRDNDAVETCDSLCPRHDDYAGCPDQERRWQVEERATQHKPFACLPDGRRRESRGEVNTECYKS